MRIYDTLIIGSGYTSLGYAATASDTLIVEERQICDTVFYLSLPTYSFDRALPVAEEGRAFYKYYSDRGLFCGGMQDLNAFESAFCAYALENDIEILLKSRVINSTLTDGGIYEARVISPSGIITVCAKRIIDMRSREGKGSLTLLFSVRDKKSDVASLKTAFPGAIVEQAFYPDRYAVHVPTEDDYITAKKKAHALCHGINGGARLIYTAPAIYLKRDEGGVPTDNAFSDPVSAFAAGVAYAKAVAQK